jgi:small subunit ribosomal protein S1
MKIIEGQVVEGKITRVMTEAVFVDIGIALDAVIPKKDLDKLNPNQLDNIQEGETIEVCIMHLPRHNGNPIVSIAQALGLQDQPSYQSHDEDPWSSIEATYQVGDIVKGTVKNIKKFGAFVELPLGIDGLVHVSEMQPGFTTSPWDVVRSGEQITVRIIHIDPDRKRIGLSLKDITQ